jgi:hypothetical protein
MANIRFEQILNILRRSALVEKGTVPGHDNKVYAFHNEKLGFQVTLEEDKIKYILHFDMLPAFQRDSKDDIIRAIGLILIDFYKFVKNYELEHEIECLGRCKDSTEVYTRLRVKSYI